MDQNNNQDTGKYTFVSEKIVSKKKRRIKRAVFITLFTIVLAVVFGLVSRVVFITSNDFLCNLFGIEVEKKEEPKREPVVLAGNDDISSSITPSVNIDNNQGSNPDEGNNSLQSGTKPDDKGNPDDNINPDDSIGSSGNSDGKKEDDNPIGTGDENTPTPSPEGENDKLDVGDNDTKLDDKSSDQASKDNNNGETDSEPTPTPVVLERRISATIDDFITVYSEIKKLSLKVSSSLLRITTTTRGVNWMNEEIEVKNEITGIIMAEDRVSLLLLTSYDKVKDVDRLQVSFPSSLTLDATIYDYDSDYNLAVIAVNLDEIPDSVRKNISKVSLADSVVLYEGMPIIALGSPNGYIGSVEYGFITSRGSSIYITDNKIELFNTDITDNENSDGIIVDFRGQLLGIISHTLKEENNQNISTAISVSKLKPVIIKLLNGKDRIYFGIKGEDIPDSILSERNLENGIYVTEIQNSSPAYLAGLKKGDILTRIDEKPVLSMDGFNTVITDYEPGKVVTAIIYRRQGSELEELKFEVELAKKIK